jgi:hypothetical protein
MLAELSELKGKIRAFLAAHGVVPGDRPARENEDPDDPGATFAMVGAPKLPRTPLRHSAIAIEPES